MPAKRGKQLLSHSLVIIGIVALFASALRSVSSAQERPDDLHSTVHQQVFLPLIIASSEQAQSDYYRHVRTIETDRMGIPRPAGVAYSPATDTFLIVQPRDPEQSQPGTTNLFMLTQLEELAGSVSIAATIPDSLNITYNGKANRLLLLNAATNELLEIETGPARALDPATLTRFDVRQFGLQNPRGMTLDPQSGRLFILDSAAHQIVWVDPGPDQSYDGAAALRDGRIGQVDLKPLGLVDLRGLAFNPMNGHLYVLSAAKESLYELTQTGQLVATRDLSNSSDFRLIDPQGMVFGPSFDQTDDPSVMNLYIVDRRLGDRWQRQGQIEELSLIQPVRPNLIGVTAVQASLVRTTNLNTWSPPSPDPMGAGYDPATNRLVISDSEVEEMPPYWVGVNLFVANLAGGLIETHTTSPSYSDEPTGVAFNPVNGHCFISDDDKKDVFELTPGADGQCFTSDDVRTQFDTTAVGIGDPEGLAFNTWNGHLLFAGGEFGEFHDINPGPNGRFDGGGDDIVTQWDTASLGLPDP